MTDTTVPRIARVVSAASFPLLMPTYAVAILFLFTYLSHIPGGIRLMVTVVTFAVTAALPAVGIYILYKVGKITDPALNERRERTIPFCFTVPSYIATAFYFQSISAPWWMSAFMFGAAVALLISLIINLKWKISGHAMGMGGLTAMSLYLASRGWLTMFGYGLPLAMLLLSGLVATCRLLLGRHTLSQVAAGFALGFVAIYLSIIM